ncbi:MAG: hypothetical protein DMG08_07035, partial [Acidobacteria bacterium]
MRITQHTCAITVFLLGTALVLGAQEQAPPTVRGGGTQDGFGRGGPQFDQAAIDRGRKEFVA